MNIRRTQALLTLLISLPEGVLAQQQAALRSSLGSPIVEFREPFARIGNVRELPDGRVLVGDVPEKRLLVVDFAQKTVRQIGLNGSGPNEYDSTPMLHPLRGDSTLAVVATSRRWLLLKGDSIVMTVPSDAAAMIATGGTALGSDRLGNLVTWRLKPLKPGISEVGSGDSADVLRIALSTGKAELVTRLRRTAQTFTGWENVGGRPFYFISRQAFAVGEATAMAPDGWIAVLRVEPYRVDWYPPGRGVLRGPPIPYVPVKVTEREKRFYLDMNSRAATAVPTLPPSLTAEQRAATLAGLRRQWSDFPATIPPFGLPNFTAMSDDAAFIRRNVSADSPDPVFDAIDRTGKLIGRLRLQRGERLVGAGRGCLYVAAEDEDGLDHLRKYAWP